jgi:excisionase family DNA binding protein
MKNPSRKPESSGRSPRDADAFCTVAEAAAILGVSASTIWRWVDARRLPAFRLGPKAIRIKRGDLARALRPVPEARRLPRRIQTIHTSLEKRPPLTEAERQRRYALLEEMRVARAEQRRRNGGKPLSDSTEIIRADREERSRRWW